MDPDDPPKTVGVEKRPVDERNALGHGVEKSEIGIKQQDPGEDQWEIWNEISDPTERLEEFTAGHVCARDEPSENHGQNHGGNQAHDGKDKTHPQRAQRAGIRKSPKPISQSVHDSLSPRSKAENTGQKEQQRQPHGYREESQQ